MKKILSLVLICLLLVTMLPTSVFAASKSEVFHGRLTNGASQSHTLTVASDTSVRIVFSQSANPYVDANGVPYAVTEGAYIFNIIDSSGKSVFYKSGDFIETVIYNVDLKKGTYSFVLTENEDPNADPNGFLYFGRTLTYVADLTWNETVQSGNTGNNSSSNTGNSGQTTTPVEKPSSSTQTSNGTTSSTAKPNTSTPAVGNEDTADKDATKEDVIETNTKIKVEKTTNAVVATTEKGESTYELPVELIKEAADENKDLIIKNNLAVVTLDKEALSSIIKSAGNAKNVSVNLESIKISKLNDKQKDFLKDVDTVTIISLEILADGKVISKDFGSGKAKVAIPFEAPKEGTEEEYGVVYVANDGSFELLTSNYTEGFMIVELEHFSEYAIVKTSTLPGMETTIDADENSSILPFIIGGIVIAAAGAGGFYYYRKKKVQ